MRSPLVAQHWKRSLVPLRVAENSEVPIEHGSGVLLALDYGLKRTGVAVSDPTWTIVRPLDVVNKANSSEGLDTIVRLLESHDVTRVIVGLPIGLGGDETKQTAQSRSFAARVRQLAAGIPVELHDERFTSRLADQTIAKTGTGASRDSLAACHLLESWMEGHRR